MSSPVVVDGRSDRDKLTELLLIGAEQPQLDFKRFEDLSDDKSRLDLVKDMLAIANTGGGFIVIGVDDQGLLALGPQVNVEQWDSAELVRQVRSYTQIAPNITSAVHQIDDRPIVLVAIDPAPEGLPIPFSKNGDHGSPTKRRFSKGEIWFRQGTENTLVDYAHWASVLSGYRARLIDEASRTSEQLVARIIDAIDRRDPCEEDEDRNPKPRANPPLAPGSAWPQLDEGMAVAAENDSTVRLQRYLNELAALGRHVNPSDHANDHLRYLDEVAHVAIAGVRYNRVDIYNLALATMNAMYESAGFVGDDIPITSPSAVSIVQYRLDVIVRLFVVGSYVVRRDALSLVPGSVLRPFRTAAWYSFTSWIRHASVYAARANLLLSDGGGVRGGLLLSLARKAAVDTPVLRPDIPDTAIDLEPADGRDALLDSLCQYDLAALLVVSADEDKSTGYYPASAFFMQSRAQPLLDRYVEDAEVRRALLPGRTVHESATALRLALDTELATSRESGFTWSSRNSSEVSAFLSRYPDRTVDNDQ
jgi:hypothetical protein